MNILRQLGVARLLFSDKDHVLLPGHFGLLMYVDSGGDYSGPRDKGRDAVASVDVEVIIPRWGELCDLICIRNKLSSFMEKSSSVGFGYCSLPSLHHIH